MEPPAKGRRLVFDDHREAPKGFGLRITAAARKRAGELRREIDGGADILEERRRERVAENVPRQAALLRGYIKGLFAWAEDRELVDVNPAATLRP